MVRATNDLQVFWRNESVNPYISRATVGSILQQNVKKRLLYFCTQLYTLENKLYIRALATQLFFSVWFKQEANFSWDCLENFNIILVLFWNRLVPRVLSFLPLREDSGNEVAFEVCSIFIDPCSSPCIRVDCMNTSP